MKRIVIVIMSMSLLCALFIAVLTGVYQYAHSAQMAVNQMQIAGSQDYMVYHNVAETIYTVCVLCGITVSIGATLYTIYVIMKRGNKK